jgi:Amt family ammonium transporter
MKIGSLKRLFRPVEVCAGCAGVVALFSWSSWLGGDTELAAFGSGYLPMAPSTACSIILLSLAVIIRQVRPSSEIARRVAAFLALTVGAFGLLIAAQQLFRFELPVEFWLAPSAQQVGGFPSGRMSLATAASLLGLSAALVLELRPFARRWIVRQAAAFLALAAVVGGALVVLSYALGMPLLYGSQSIPMALPTAIALVLLGVSIAAAAGKDVVPLLLVRFEAPETLGSRSRWPERSAVSAVVLLTGCVGIVGYRYFGHQIAESRQKAEDELSAIADLKVRQLLDWRSERLSDAQNIKQEPFLREAVQRFFNKQSDTALLTSLQGWLQSVRVHNQSIRALLLDEQLSARMVYPADKTYFGPIAAEFCAKALKSNRIVVSDLHRSRFSGEIHFDLAIPLESPTAASNPSEAAQPASRPRPQGVLLIEVDPCKFIYPLIEDWPTPSRTGETLLVQRDGDDLLYLNDLRHRPDTALTLRLPIKENRQIPAVLAVEGREGVIEGVDYRNEPVLAVARSVAGTPWHLIAKVDQSEIYTPLRERAWNTAIVLLAIVVAAALGVSFLWRRQDHRWLHDQLAIKREAAVALEREAVRYRTIMDASMDGICILDSQGNLLECNNAFLDGLGYSRDEAQRLHVCDWSAQWSRSEVLGLMRSQWIHGATFETRDRRKDGSLMDVEVNVAPMSLDGRFLFCISVHDISHRKRAEEELTFKNSLLLAQQEASLDGILAVDGDNNVLLRNRQFNEMMSIPPELADSKDDAPVLQTVLTRVADPDAFLERVRYLYDHRQETSRDELAFKDGRIFDRYSTPMLGPSGHHYGRIWFFRDITETKKAEAALRESEQRFIGVLQASQDAILLLDGEKFIDCNEATCRILGYASREEFLMVHPSRLSPPTQPDGRDSFEKAEEMIRTAFEKGFHSFEWMHRKANGEDFPVVVSLTAVPLRGRTILQSHWRDIGEQKRIQAAILNAKQEWENTFDVVPDIITILDTEHRIVRANKALAERVGLTPRDCIGQPCHRLMHGTACPPGDCVYRKTLADGEYHEAEVFDECSGNYFWVSVSPLRDAGGKLTGCVHVARDITAQKSAEIELVRHRDHLEDLVYTRTAEADESRMLAEESNAQLTIALKQANDLTQKAQQASHAKSRFLASMSHELRTPLNGVIGMIDLLSRTSLDDRQRRFADTSRESALALLQLINDILDFSKIEAGRLELERSEFSLPHVVRDAVQVVAPKAGEKHLELITYIAPECQRVVLGDGGRVQQVLVNLLGNAVKFTAHGEICLQVTKLEEGPDWIVPKFKVVDTGIGIPADRRDRLFQSFTQIDSSTTRKFGGTGLGLVISKSLVEAMGGQIGVESTEGAGSTFWFTLRIETSAESPQIEMVLPAGLRSLRTLVVAGNDALQAALVEYCESWGLRAESVRSAAEAMIHLRDAAVRPIDLMVIDEEIADGVRLAADIRQSLGIPQPLLIVLAPFAQHESSDTRPCPANCRYIVKPICQSIIFDAIVDLCATSHEPASEPIDSPSAETHSNRSRHAGKARILVAEDNRVNQMYCMEILRLAGLASECVENGIEAVEAARSGRYDLILMDCHMPEMDGYEASWRIIRYEHDNPTVGHLPIIALTANAIKGDREVCLDAGMDDYLSKPFQGKQLVEMIDRWLDKHAPAGSLDSEVPTPPPAVDATVATDPQSAAAGDAWPLSFDFDGLWDRCMGNADFAMSLLEELRNNAPGQLADLARQIQSGASAEAAKTAHSLKGAAGILCAEPLRAVAAEIEAAGKAGDILHAVALLEDIRIETERCLNSLPEILARLTTRKGAIS